MKNVVRRIPCGDLDVFVSVDGYQADWHSFFFATKVLFFMQKGTAWLKINGKETRVGQGKFCLIDRGVKGYIKKTWQPEDQHAEMVAFALHPTFLQQVQGKIVSGESKIDGSRSNFYVLPQNPVLKGLFDSIVDYIKAGHQLESRVVELKTLEALLGILRFHPACNHLFDVKNAVTRTSIKDLMESNFTYNIPIQEFAKLSGRSLSTFQREFKVQYGISPYQWIRRRRLQRAREILLHTNRKPVDFYLELGFESLAHFSRLFKQEFGVTLSEFKQRNTG